MSYCTFSKAALLSFLLDSHLVLRSAHLLQPCRCIAVSVQQVGRVHPATLMPVIVTVLKPYLNKHMGVARKCHKRLFLYFRRQTESFSQNVYNVLPTH
jgi:hypothetical protein